MSLKKLSLLLLMLTVPAMSEAAVGAAYDALTSVGAAVPLRAKFEHNLGRWIRPDFEDADVTFKLAGKVLGKVKTNNNGIASFSYTPSKVGVFPFSATLHARKLTVKGQLTVLKKGQPVIVFDIDGTLSDLPEWLVPFSGGSAKAYPHSPELAHALAKKYSIVYLTARDDSFVPETLSFLKRHKFPKGTVIYNEYGGEVNKDIGNQLNSDNHGKFKAWILNSLKKRGLNLVAGIGNAPTDAEAYVAAGIKSYVRNEKSFKKTYSFTDYKKLWRKLNKDGVLAAPPPK